MSVLLDVLLSRRELPLSLLKQYPEQPIQVEPLFSLPRDAKQTRVGLKDFDFIRCIGSGGFSKVRATFDGRCTWCARGRVASTSR